jgi:WD40 repeat protein
MGAFFGSIHFHTDDRSAVKKLLEQIAAKQKARFLIGPALRGWIGVYPSGSGQDEGISRTLAKRFPGELLHMLVHDDDIFAYFFYREGQLVDQYNSCPDYFEESSESEREEARGRPELLAYLLPAGTPIDELTSLLRPDDAEGAVFASALLERFAQLFDIRNVATSYEYLMDGETDGIERWDDFVHVPDLSEERARKSEAEASISHVKQRMQAGGLLLLEKSAGGPQEETSFPIWCPNRAGDGFLVCFNNHVGPSEPRPLERYAPPWSNGPTPTGVKLNSWLHLITVSPSGRYLAASYAAGNWTAQVWDLDIDQPIVEVSHTRCVEWLGFTADDRLLVTLRSGEGFVTDVKTGRRVASLDIEHANRGAIHPSGTLAVASGQGLISLVDLLSGRIGKTLRVGQPQQMGSAYQALATQVRQQFLGIDVDKMVAGAKAGFEIQIKALEKAAARAVKPDDKLKLEETIEQVKQAMEQQIAEVRKTLEKQKQAASKPSAVLFGTEQVTCLECSPDGRLLFTGSDQGVHVYLWEEIAKASDSAPAPIFSIPTEHINSSRGDRTMSMPGSIWGLAHDSVANRLVFGGLDGKVGFLNLANGKSGTLLDPPGRAPILSLGLSRDRTSLACTCRPDLFAQGRNRKAPFLQVWNYTNLDRRIGEPTNPQ